MAAAARRRPGLPPAGRRWAACACLALALPAAGRARADTPPPLLRPVPAGDFAPRGKSFGGTWAWFDDDARPDLFFSAHAARPQIYVNAGDGAFFRARWPLPGLVPDQHGAAAGDFDGDGAWDLYVTAGADHGRGQGINRLWTVRPGAVVEAAPGDTLLADPHGRGRGALWLDLEGDARPELLVLNFATPPRLFGATDGGWRDLSGRLTLPPSPDGSPGWIATAAAADFDGDGRTDLAVGGETLVLLQGDGAGGLGDRTAAAGLPARVPPLSHLVTGDVDNDGDPDLLLVGRGGLLDLWLNDSAPGAPAFRPGPGLGQLRAAGTLPAAVLADLDNDGVLDLYVVRQAGEPSRSANLVARGLGGGRFADAAPAWGGVPDTFSPGHEAWALDLDGDGDLDLVAFHGAGDAPGRGPAVYVFRNEAPARGFTLRLEAATSGSRLALGARARLVAGAPPQAREVQAGGAPWNTTVLPLHFGTGDAPGPFELAITWPDGRRQRVLVPAPGAAYHLRQPAPGADPGEPAALAPARP